MKGMQMVSGSFAVAAALVFVQGVDGQEAGRAMMTAQATAFESETARAVHLLQRATFGPRPEDIEVVLAMGTEGWLDWQLEPSAIADPASVAVVSAFPGATATIPDLLRQYPPIQLIQPLRTLSQDTSLTDEERQTIRQQLQGTNPNVLLNDLVGARLYRSAYSERQLEEMMTQFWFDHFNVFFRKNQVSVLVSDYEATAIRPNVFGSFYDMLVATASHPAMLYYLDNAQSVAPDSSLAAVRLAQLSAQYGDVGARVGRGRGGRGNFPARTGAGGRLGAGASYEDVLRDSLRILQTEQAQAVRQGRGLNENYARELLELHTLGVEGGYTQDDIIQVARAFSGWGVSPVALGNQRNRGAQRGAGGRGGAGEPGGRAEQLREAALAGTLAVEDISAGIDLSTSYQFQFRASQHDAKVKHVLGHDLPPGRGLEDGMAVLEIVATHPSTARFIASQLAKRFVSDSPPEALIDHLAEVFTESGGDLRQVTKALFSAEEFYATEAINARVKSPFTLLASAVRLTGAEILAVRPIIQQLTTLGEVPYMADAPIGYPQESSMWVSSGAMLNRMNLGLDFAAGRFRGIRLTGGAAARGRRGEDGAPLEELAKRLLPGANTEILLATIRDELARSDTQTPREQASMALGLILGSPEFQRH